MRRVNNEYGVSLIVLVITIIVMLILTSVVVLALQNSGIIEKANNAVHEYSEAEVKHLAALIWADAFMDELRGDALVNKVKEELSKQKITEVNWNIAVDDTGVTVTKKEAGGSQEENVTDDSVISFTIDGNEYQAEVGSTWAKFCKGQIEPTEEIPIYLSGAGIVYYACDEEGNYTAAGHPINEVSESSVIVAGTNYTTTRSNQGAAH